MANMRLPASTRNALADKIRDLIDAGSGAGTMLFYSGVQPAAGGGGLSGNTLAGTLTFTDPSAAGAAAGTSNASAITRDNAADAAVTITWARIKDSAGAVVFDCDVGLVGSGATIELIEVAVVLGQPIEVSAFSWTMPAG
jgi:hypothetical protein